MKVSRFIPLLLLLFSLAGCGAKSNERGLALISDANKLLSRQGDLMVAWAPEFGQTFSKENRDQFPANRDSFANRTPKLIATVDEMLRLGDEVIKKYAEADPLLTKETERKGFALLAESFKMDQEMYQMFKTQAQLVSDNSINDAKTLNEKYDHLTTQILQKQQAKDKKFQEGKTLLQTK